MLKRLITVCLIACLCSTAVGMGLTVDDYVKDYNGKFTLTLDGCEDVATDMYRMVDSRFQKANLAVYSIRLQTRGRENGHRIVTYTEGRQRYVITTWSDDNATMYVKHKCVGVKSVHEVCKSLMPGYKYVRQWTKGFGWREKTRYEMMVEGGHRVKEEYDIWGKGEQNTRRRRYK